MFALYLYGEQREKKACQIDTDESSSENVTELPEVRWGPQTYDIFNWNDTDHRKQSGN